MDNFLFIKQNHKHLRIDIRDILFIKADGSYLIVVTSNAQFSLAQNLSQFLKRNKFTSLLRIHRSYIVNLDYINSFDHRFAYVGNEQIPIGDIYRMALLKRVTTI